MQDSTRPRSGVDKSLVARRRLLIRLSRLSTVEMMMAVARVLRGSLREREQGGSLSGPKSGTFAKKTYHRPTCTPKSISEIGALLRRKITDHENTSETHDVDDSIDMPILLVEGYEGDLDLIKQMSRTPARQLEPFSILKGEGFVEMQFAHEQNATPSETFLLLDLRHRSRGGRGLLESIGLNPTLSDAVPCVVLVSSMEQFDYWRGIDTVDCWQLRGAPSPVDLAAALRSFFNLCAISAKQSPNKRSAFDKTDNHALIAKPNEE